MRKSIMKPVDDKGRELPRGIRQRKDGSYEYRYTDIFGKKKSVYSRKLYATDKVEGDQRKPCIIDLMKKIERDLYDGITMEGGKLSVYELCERYTKTKTGVRPTTETGYKTVLNILKNETFAQKRIDTIRTSDAKLFLIKLQKEDGRSYSTIHNVRGVLRPAFQMAVEDDYLRKNPFDFQLHTVLVNDMHIREAISRDQMRKFLKFMKEDEHFAEYYDVAFILFHTGLRISELCGLTLSQINLKDRVIKVDHQLQRKQDGTLYCNETKTVSGERSIPMTDEVYEAFRRVIANRNAPYDVMVDGYTGFVWMNTKARKGLRPYVAMDYEHVFKRAVDKYNSIYRVQMPRITPHVCRHTYCSNMAKSGMNPKVLQYLMGHSDIGVTMNTYTHLGLEASQNELSRLDLETIEKLG